MSADAGYVVEFAQDHAGEWRWSCSDAGNHEVMSVASEGYERRIDAVNAARDVCPENSTFRFPDDP